MRWWMRRLLAPIGIAVVGIVLIALPLCVGLGGTAENFEALVTGVSPAFEPPRFENARDDLERLDAITAEFFDGVIPSLTLPLLSSEERIVAGFDASYPAVMGGIRALPGYAERFIPMLEAAISQRTNLARAGEIATAGIPATSVPPALVGAGAIAVVAAAAVALGVRRSGAVVATVLGIVLVTTPLVAALPEKTAAAAELDRSLAPIATAETVAAAREALETAVALEREFHEEMLPDLARRIPFMNEAGLLEIVDAGFPAIARGLATFGGQIASFGELTGVLEGNLDHFDAVHGTDLGRIINWVIVLGAMLIAAGIAAVVPIAPRPHRSPEPEGRKS